MSIQQYIAIVLARRRAVLALIGVALLIAGAVSFLQSRTYVANSDLVIEARSTDPVTGANLPSQLIPGYLETQAAIISSENVALKVVDKLNLTEDRALRERYESGGGEIPMRNWIARKLLNRFHVKFSQEHSVLELRFQNENRVRAADIVNAFAQAYIQTIQDFNAAAMVQSKAFFDRQIRDLRAQLEAAQRRLSSFQQKNGILTAEERNDVDLAQLSQTSSQLAVARAKTAEAVSKLQQAQQYLKTGDAGSSVPEVLASGMIQQLKAERTKLENELAEVSAHYTAQHPQYQRLAGAIRLVNRRMNEETERILGSAAENVRVARQSEIELQKAIDEQKAALLGKKKLRDEAAVLGRDVENAQRIYDNALQRAGHTKLEGQTTQTNVTVLNPATIPERPSSPNVARNVLIALIAGVMAGVLAALALERRDRRIRSVRDLVLDFSLPVLAEFKAVPTPRLTMPRGLLPRREQPALADRIN